MVRVYAPFQSLAERQAATLSQRWEQQFQRRRATAGDLSEALGKLEADERTAEAEGAVDALTSILLHTLRVVPQIDWTPLYDTASFAETAPSQPAAPSVEAEPQPEDFPRLPLTLATLLNPRAMARRKQAAEAKYRNAHDGWLYLKRWREQEYEKTVSAYRAAASDWQSRQTAFIDGQQRTNARIDALVQGYSAGEAEAVVGHSDLALLSLDRPAGFARFWTASFAGGTLHLDYDMPSMDVVPVIKAVKYVPARGAFDVVALAERERERIYGEAVFQTCLAALYTLFATDTIGAIKSVSFNGWANYIDAAAARPGRACILSIVVGKEAFMGLDLSGIDPQACFRALNGSMSPKLAALVGRGV